MGPFRGSGADFGAMLGDLRGLSSSWTTFFSPRSPLGALLDEMFMDFEVDADFHCDFDIIWGPPGLSPGLENRALTWAKR